MKMYNDWYNCPSQQNEASWAAIHIAVALGLRVPTGDTLQANSYDKSVSSRCLNNAQAVVSRLVTRDTDLLGIQVLLGIVFLLENSSDLGSSSVVIGAAVRLAHRMELQSLVVQQTYTETEAEQRSRVFWITYTLDKVRPILRLMCQ
jgi:hypothetical protein